MVQNKVIHLAQPNTLYKFLSKKERQEIVSLKVTGVLGYNDFNDVLDEMCDVYGEYDEHDNFIIDYKETPALRHLDLGEAIYVDGDTLPEFGYRAQLESLILPNGITSTVYRGDVESGFSESENLKTLVLPNGLKEIGGFNSCENLSDLVLPEGLTTINIYAFSGCRSITSIHIPSTVKELHGSSFSGCSISKYEVDEENPYYIAIDGVIYSKDLNTLIAFPSDYPEKQFVVPSTTKVIDDSAFMDSHVNTVILPNSLTEIRKHAFAFSSIRRLTIPNSVTSIGELTFRHCYQLEQLVLSNSLLTIPEQMVTSCSKLKTLEIPPSVKYLHYSAFAWCDLEHLILNNGLEEITDDGVMLMRRSTLQEISLPKTLKKVPGGAFNYSPFIKAFNIDPKNPFFTIIDGALCSKDGKILYSVPDFDRESFVVPEGIEVIEERVFAFMPKLKNIILPNSLRKIKSRAFQNTNSLKEIRIPSKVTNIHIDALWSDSLKAIIMESYLPPTITGPIRDYEWRYKDVSLIVPPNTLDSYKKAKGWDAFDIQSPSA